MKMSLLLQNMSPFQRNPPPNRKCKNHPPYCPKASINPCRYL